MKLKFGVREWILVAVLLFMLVAISPRPWLDGVTITSVGTNTPAAEAGITGPTSTEQPVTRERILAVNLIEVHSVDEYANAVATILPNTSVQVRTTRDSYVVQVPPADTTIPTFDNETGEENGTIEVAGGFNPDDPLGIRVSEPAATNIRKGLDLTGGARVLLRPETPVSQDVMELVLDNIQQRLNVFGLSDVIVRATKDFSGNDYILVEIAGASEESITELLTSQGRFEAKIGDKVVFRGGEDDITHVGRSATESGITRCTPQSDGSYACEFYFVITLTQEAAHRQALATMNLSVVPSESGQSYLNESLGLFLDGENVSELRISSGLRGSETTSIQISGSEVGVTELEAAESAAGEMRRLQTLLSTGSLPVQLVVVKSDGISPALGHTFINNILLVGLLAILAVIIVVASRYRDWRIGVPMVITMLSEVVIILGIAAMIGWNLDLAAIAGILVAIGTGVDDQIIIVDEIKTGQKGGSWKQRLKKAFFIIFAAFFTLLAAMLPLMWAGAGLVRGFALTTVMGVTVGVLITRPAFAAIAEKIVKTD